MTTPVSTLDRVLADPNWFPDDFDSEKGDIRFAEVTRDQLAAQSFLDRRWNRSSLRRGRVHLSAVGEKLAGKAPPNNLRFIWHTGFCCSTLLARALNAPGRNLSLCEPQLLMYATEVKREREMRPDLSELPDIAFALLSRGFAPEELVTIKPAPFVNYLVPEAMALPQSRHLFLYSDCESFLVSALRRETEGASYIRSMLENMRRNGIASEWTDEKILALPPLRATALLWHMEVAELRKNERGARSLDCDAFLADPETVLNAMDEFFALGLGPDHIRTVVEGPLFRQDSKNPAAEFNTARRREIQEAARRQIGAQLNDAISWSYEIFPDTPRGAPFSTPLVPIEKAYA
ncbi:MAG TPA: hypothetical protein VG867_03265 [Rhizomicrobium sp.]|nr:hypothetical protein [Rhizomicrobium sp.]